MATASSKEGHRTQDTGVWNFFWNLIPRDNSNANNNGNGSNSNNNNNTSHHTASGNTPTKPVTTKRDTHKQQQTHRSRRVVVKKGRGAAAVALAECGFEPCLVVSSLLLCLWDNIAGPKVEQVWIGSETLKEELQLYTARHTLCGVVGQPEQDPAKIETKFHVNSEQGYMITSTIFSASYLGSTNKFSLSILIKQCFLSKYLVLNSIVEDRLHKLVLKMQATLNKNQESMMEKFTKELGRFCENMEVLFDVQDCAGLSSTPTSSRPCTNPSHPHHPIHTQSSPPSNIARPSASPTSSSSSLSPSPSFNLSSPSFNMSPSPSSFNLSDRAREPYSRLKDTLFFAPPAHDDFLIKAITSHLQTHGSTVVTGPNVESVNMFVETLAMFLGPSAKDRKRVGLADPKREYTADLLLQGIVGHGVKLIDESVLPNMLPTTWIDLEHHSIKQTPPFHEYGLLRKHFGDFELGQFIDEPDLPATQNLHDLLKDGLFKPPKPEILASPLVHRIISEIYRLPPSLREACISQGFRLLLRKATVMIKYVEAELNKRNTPEELGEEVRTRVQENLGLTKGDFAVLLGLAEKLKPKFYVTLVGDPSVIQEKFIELFDTF